MSKYLKDALERVLWTAAEAGVATAVVVLPETHLPYYLVPVIGTGLAILKAAVAKHIGNADTASTVPTV